MAAARSTAAAVDDVTSTVVGASTSTLDRLSAWYSDNKVAAWTIAGVTVVVAGGSIYYLSQPKNSTSAAAKPKNSKKKAAQKDVEKAAEESVTSSKAGG
jgi:import receptor subunit TOM70